MVFLKVKVIPGVRENKVEKLEDGSFKVWVTDVPEKGKANKKLIEILSKHLCIDKKSLEIHSGQKSRIKIISIKDS